MFLIAPVANAGDIALSLKDQKGEPVEDAVISLAPQFALEATTSMTNAEMRQQGTMFSPFVLPVTVGTTVFFPNFDEFRHQVYSFSKTKRFELRLYGQDESKSVKFDTPGIVALGCNIHDNMLAYIYVSEHPIVAKSDATGAAVLSNLQPGDYMMHVWHPDMPTSAAPAPVRITVSAEGLVSVEQVLPLRAVRRLQQPPEEDEYS